MGSARAARPRLGRKGFTLVELAVALAIAVTLASLALPYYGDYLARHRLMAAAQGLALDLGEARHEAARRGSTMHVKFSAGGDWCYAVSAAPGCGCDAAAAAACRPKTVHGGAFAGVALIDATDLSFDPAGSAAPRAIRLQTVKGQTLAVQVSALGRARVCAPQGNIAGYAGC